MPITARADTPSYILPEALYPLQSFLTAAGVSYCRVKAARRDHIELPLLRTGKRAYVRGADAIRFIELLAEQTAKQSAAKAAKQAALDDLEDLV